MSIRKLSSRPTVQELAQIHNLLSAAFNGDVKITALSGGRSSLETHYFDYLLQAGLAEGEIHVAGTDGRIDGVLIVYAPGQDVKTNDGCYQEKSNDYVSKLPSEMQQWWIHHVRPKYAELANVALGSEEARRAAWHIRLIAVHPDHQRKGIARQLMESVQRKANAGRQKMCTECHNDKLVRLFSRFGFRVKGTKNFSSYQGGFPLFCMVREPPQ